MNDPETILQISLHSLPEYVDLVLQEAESRQVNVADLRTEYDNNPDGEFIGEICDDVLSRLSADDYTNIECDDTLLIMPKGVDLPPQWME